ncbi:hypothetical protein [Campylobacter sp.]|uniref:hypothetical protein n=1 Tax=Campylobacter sp. TaxID=205 RepID=UPI0027067BF0|nr:hypothetical protein [Campylobacter sp.]
MKFKGFLFAFAGAILFSGCAGALNHSLNDDRSWIKYLENDTSLQSVSLNQKAANSYKFGDVIGSATVKSSLNHADINLGDIYFVDKIKSVIVVDLDANKNINISDKDELASLQSSKNIKFYEFGGGMIESVIYSSEQKPVCKAFYSSLEPINTRSVTNYYKNLHSDKSEFFTTIIEAKIIGNKGFEIKNLEFKFHINQKDRGEVERYVRSDTFKKDGIDQDMLKQGRFLLNVLCRSMFF